MLVCPGVEIKFGPRGLRIGGCAVMGVLLTFGQDVGVIETFGDVNLIPGYGSLSPDIFFLKLVPFFDFFFNCNYFFGFT